MHDRDCLHRFMFEHYPIRGHIVHLDAAWRALLEHRDYPTSIRALLGESVAASVLLAATLKFDGTLSLELRGQGPMHLMLAQCSSDLGVRAVARFHDSPEEGGIRALSGAGNLTVTLENEDLSQRYQGVVRLESDRLSDSLQSYFENSEQLPTRLWLHADERGVSGMLLQRLPGDAVAGRLKSPVGTSVGAPVGTPAGTPHIATDAEELDDAWRRVQLMADTLKPTELRTLTDKQILQRVFAEDDVRLFEATPVSFRCRCSRERVIGMLRALGADEIRSILAERGNVEVRCDFCNRAYQFDPVDVEHLLSPASHVDRSGATH
jgi:molecular chaperone Hsp33